jgi:hypothetical protein
LFNKSNRLPDFSSRRKYSHNFTTGIKAAAPPDPYIRHCGKYHRLTNRAEPLIISLFDFPSARKAEKPESLVKKDFREMVP